VYGLLKFLFFVVNDDDDEDDEDVFEQLDGNCNGSFSYGRYVLKRFVNDVEEFFFHLNLLTTKMTTMSVVDLDHDNTQLVIYALT